MHHIIVKFVNELLSLKCPLATCITLSVSIKCHFTDFPNAENYAKKTPPAIAGGALINY
jgi:hypothetical protein